MTMMDQMVYEGLDWRNGTLYHDMARNRVAYGQQIYHAVFFNIFHPVVLSAHRFNSVMMTMETLHIHKESQMHSPAWIHSLLHFENNTAEVK